MKPIATAKLPSRAKDHAFELSPEHDAGIAVFLARFAATRDIGVIIDAKRWADATKHSPMLGGASDAAFRLWFDQQVEALDALTAAATFIEQDGDRLDDELPARREQAQESIEQLESTIAELNKALADQRQQLAGVEADAMGLTRARQAIATAEANAEQGSLEGLAWRYLSTHSHPFESETEPDAKPTTRNARPTEKRVPRR